MFDRRLVAVVSAMYTVETIRYLSEDRQRVIINRLTDALLPFANENFTPACYFLARYHADAAQKEAWLEKAASLGVINAMFDVFKKSVMKKAQPDQVINLLVKYLKFHMTKTGEQVEFSGDANLYFAWRGFDMLEYAEEINKRLAAFTLTPTEIEAAHFIPDCSRVFKANEEEEKYLLAVYNNDLKYVQDHLKAGGNPFVDGGENLTALHLAIATKHNEMLKFLISVYQEYGFCLNHKIDDDGDCPMSPILFAVYHSNTQAIEMLFEAGVSPGSLKEEIKQYDLIVSDASKKVIECYESRQTNALKVFATPIIRLDDKSIASQSFDLVPSENEGVAPSWVLRDHSIDNQQEFLSVLHCMFLYNIVTYNHIFERDDCDLEVLVGFDNGNLGARFYQLVTQHFNDAGVVWHFKGITKYPDGMKYGLTFPRDSLSLLIDYIFVLHQKHILAIAMDQSIEKFDILEDIKPQTRERLDSFLMADLPSKRFNPMLFDYEYLRLTQLAFVEDTSKVYRNYCAIRLCARLFAAGLANGSLVVSYDILIKVASMVSDYAIHNEKESLEIARANFHRLPDKIYTPRFFVPKPFLEAAPIETASPTLGT